MAEINEATGIKSPKARKYIYTVIVAAVPLLIFLGILTEEVAGQVLIIAAAVLGVGGPALAAANVGEEEIEIPSDEDQGIDPEDDDGIAGGDDLGIEVDPLGEATVEEDEATEAELTEAAEMELGVPEEAETGDYSADEPIDGEPVR